jgi:hypothetical protein
LQFLHARQVLQRFWMGRVHLVLPADKTEAEQCLRSTCHDSMLSIFFADLRLAEGPGRSRERFPSLVNLDRKKG